MDGGLTYKGWGGVGRTLGFPAHPGAPAGWEGPFVLALQVAISALDALPDARALKDAVRCAVAVAVADVTLHMLTGTWVRQVRALFQRLVVALGRALLPYLAPVVARLVRDGRPQDLIDVAPVLGQLAYRFKVRGCVGSLS